VQAPADRVTTIFRRLSMAAVPLPELAKLLGEEGFPVSEAVLLRSLAAEPERFRVLEPWRTLGRPCIEGSSPWDGHTWILPAPAAAPREFADPERPALRRLRSTLIRLGWQLDRTCATDVARWLGMILEAERFRAELPPEACRVPPEGVSLAGEGARTATPRRRPRTCGPAPATPHPARQSRVLPPGSRSG